MNAHEALYLAAMTVLYAFAYVGLIAILCRILANLPKDHE
jgi:hypothetical protein